MEKRYIEIDISEKGYCTIKALKGCETKIIQKHVGDIENLKSLLNTINTVKYEKLIGLIKNYMGLIEASFEVILKNDADTLKGSDFGLYETVGTYLFIYFIYFKYCFLVH